MDMIQERFEMREALVREIEKERIRAQIIAEELECMRLLEERIIRLTGVPRPQPMGTEKEVILLSKRSGESLCGPKRKSVTPDSKGSSETHADISKQKGKKEWSCAICQVSSTSERGLNNHLQGRKHHLKEAALIAGKTGANIGLGVAPKKPIAEPVKLSLKTVDLSSSEKTKSETKKILVNETPETIRTPVTPESSDTKAEAIKKENKSSNFKFWCEMCQIGAHTDDVMDNHKKGKKHLNKQRRKGKVDTEAPATEKVCDANEETETETKNVVHVEMVTCDMKTDTQTMKSIVSKEAKSETETKKEVVVEAFKTVTDDKQDFTEDKADIVVEAIKKENKSNNFKFWCETCQIGTHSDDVMMKHKKGKKHLNKQLRKGKVDTEAPATEKVCDANEETETETKNVVHVEMVTCDMKTDTQTMKSVDVEIVSKEAKSETETKKEVVVEAFKTVTDDKQDFTEDKADTVVEAIKKENKSNNFKFWCETCQIGTHSDDVMLKHKNGKKHLNKQLRKGKVDTEAPATEKVCDADEETEAETKNVVHVEMVTFDMKTDTQTMMSVDVEIIAKEAKCETETKKEVVAEALKTVTYDKQDVTEDEADTMVEVIKKENRSNNLKFWCEMCQIGTHSDDVMNNHKKGKKHLNKQLRKGKVDSEAPATEKVCDVYEETETETKIAVYAEMVTCDMKTETQTMKSVDVDIVDNEAKCETETKKEVVVETFKTVTDDKQDVTEDEADTMVEAIKKENQSNNFKFWCEMCQIGAHSDDVMNNHKKGKKHLNKQLRKG